MSKFNHINNDDYKELSPNETLVEKYLNGSITESELNELMQKAKSNSSLMKEVQFASSVKNTLQQGFAEESDEEYQLAIDQITKEHNAELAKKQKIIAHLTPKFFNQTLTQKEITWLLQEYETDETVLEALEVDKRIMAFLERGGKASWLQENITNPINNLIAIFQQYYERPLFRPSGSIVRGHGTPVSDKENIFDKMQTFYDTEQNEQFIDFFESIDEKHQVRIKMRTQYAIAQFDIGNVEKAENVFKTLIAKKSRQAHKARWYLAMIYLQQNDIEKSKEYLNKVINYAKPYNKDEARKILVLLES